MTPDVEPGQFVGHDADEKLLTQDLTGLPISVGRPEPIPPSRSRGRIVGVGATLTGLTLITGVVLIVLGVIEVLSGGFGGLGILVLALGAILAGTHWGWVHVAEATANAVEHRQSREVIAGREQWLAAIEPYTRYEVTTSVAADGSITISRVRHLPVRSDERHFTFVREVDRAEVHSGEEPGATIAERAELMRRQAAADTERERQRFEIAADAYQRTQLGQLDEEQQLAVRRAESEALSEQINSNVREPPLTE
jgi:hypothetical protein